GRGGAAEGRHRPGREAQDPEGHRDRAEGGARRQPLLRRQARAADDIGQRLSRQAPRARRRDAARAARAPHRIASPVPPRRAMRRFPMIARPPLLPPAAGVYGVISYMPGVPGRPHRGPLPPLTAEEQDLIPRLQRHITAIASREHNVTHYDELEQSARYIET